MTRKQIEKLAELIGQVGVAAIIGAGGDAALNGDRIGVDVFGFVAGILLILFVLYLTRLLGGDTV